MMLECPRLYGGKARYRPQSVQNEAPIQEPSEHEKVAPESTGGVETVDTES